MAHSCDADMLFRLYTSPRDHFDRHFLICDVRDHKHYKRGHLAQSFCVRKASTGRALVDYSKAEYNIKWSDRVWEGRHVLVYGDAGLSKFHPVLEFLAAGGCASLKYFKDGYMALEKKLPFLCTASVKANCVKFYPSQIIPGQLYLGDWSHAEAAERLAELNVKSIVTIHNHPDNLKPHLARGTRWLPFQLPDIDTAEIAPCFNRTYNFCEEARGMNHAVLIHCGAGVSRSATLAMSVLMRRFSWSAAKAREHTVERRSMVSINDGFWRTLCALEPTLGITNRSDPDAGSGFRGVDAPPMAALTDETVGGRVPVQWTDAATLKKRAREEAGGEDPSSKRVKAEGGAPGAAGPEAGLAGSGGPAGQAGAAGGGGAKAGATVTLDVVKPEGVVGQLVIGPIGPHQRVIYGRLPSNDVVVEHASVSRQHAILTYDHASGGVLLTDNKSGHGTQLDEAWIKSNSAKQLRVGSKFKLGASTRLYVVKRIEVHKKSG